MRQKEKEKLLSRALEDLADHDDELRLAELLKTDPSFRKAYEEAKICHQVLQDTGIEPMPEQLREEIRRAVEREPRAKVYPDVRSPVGRFGARIATMLGNLVSKAGTVLPRDRTAIPQRPRWVMVPAAILVVGFLAAVIWQFLPEPLSARQSIAVMSFRNQTGDSTFDYLQETIPNLLITSLEQSGCFEVMTMQRLKDLVRQAGKDPGVAVLDEETAIDICRREGIKAIVVGFYTQAGNTFVTEFEVLETERGQPLETARSRGEGPTSILQAQVDEISRSVTRGVGCPSRMRAERPTSRVIDATTSSLEAYKSYLKGRDELERYLFANARQSLEQAIAIDPTFAVAHLYLSDVYANLREYDAQEAALKEAKRFAAKAPERESLYIEASYAYVIENDEEKRYRILRDLVEKYPAEKYVYVELGSYYRDHNLTTEAVAAYENALELDPEFGPALNQMAYVYVDLSEYEVAMTYFERYAASNPGDPNPIDSMAELYMRMGRLEESAAKYRQVLAAHPDFITSWLALAYVSALREDYDEVYRCIGEFTARAPSAGKNAEGRWVKAYYDYLLGRWDRSLDEYQSLRSDMADIPFQVGVTNWILGYLHADRGEYDLALEAFDAWISWLQDEDPASMVYTLVAQAITHCHVHLISGQLDDAREELAEIERLLPGLRGPDLDYKTYLFQLCSAELALACNSADDAISIAERLLPPIPSMNTVSIVMANTPLLRDVLARAYLKKGDLDRAEGEYEKLTRHTITHPDKRLLHLIHPLYHYRFGRVLEEKGDLDRARTEYEKFIDLWADADPSRPEPTDARKRLAEYPSTN